jgi:DNA-binding transcriptional LysR family regulator
MRRAIRKMPANIMHMVHARKLLAIDLNLLLVLRALLAERHVTRAAARVGLSQSATSHALARLRELYGDQLLVRRGRALLLTPRAERLLPLLERGLGDLQEAVEGEPSFEPRSARRSFTVGMADYGQAVLLGPLLRALDGQAPGIELSCVAFPNAEELAAAGDIDLAVAGSGRPFLAKLPQLPLLEDEFVCVVRRDHPQAKSKLTLERYLSLGHVVVAPSGTAGSLVDSVLGERGHQRRIALRVSSFLAAPVVVSQTDHVSTMPKRLALQLASRFRLRVLPPPIALPHFQLSLIWHPRFEHDPAHRFLRQLAVEVGKRLAPRSAG